MRLVSVFFLITVLLLTPAAGGGGGKTEEEIVKSCEEESKQFVADIQKDLRMEDWRVVLTCARPPNISIPGFSIENTLGLSQVFSETKTVAIWINYSVANKKEVVLHEMIHAALKYYRDTYTPMSDEVFTRILTDAILK